MPESPSVVTCCCWRGTRWGSRKALARPRLLGRRRRAETTYRPDRLALFHGDWNYLGSGCPRWYWLSPSWPGVRSLISRSTCSRAMAHRPRRERSTQRQTLSPGRYAKGRAAGSLDRSRISQPLRNKYPSPPMATAVTPTMHRHPGCRRSLRHTAHRYRPGWDRCDAGPPT
jgi:hypothetical protein